MIIHPAKIGVAVSKGLSIFCATCELYWRARTGGVPGDKCLSKKYCASPLGGGDFSEYVGPITDFTRWCFVCGETAFHAVSCGDGFKPIGVCKLHLSYFVILEPFNMEVPKPKITNQDGKLVFLDERYGKIKD